MPPTPKRRALHERKSSENNQIPPTSPSLRLVKDEENVDIYSANPYPTKPEQVLLPTPGGSQPQTQFQPDNGREASEGVSDTFQDHNPGSSSVTSSVESLPVGFGGPHGESVSELSSFGQAGTSSSQIWHDDANSSKTSVAHSPIHQTSQSQGDGEDEGEDDDSEDSGITLPPLPQTIKTIPAGDSSPQSTPSPPSTTQQRSTPPDGGSSPNIVPLASSSPNFVPIGSSSPNIVRTKESDSSLYSANSFGTARRYTRPGLQDQTPPIASYIYSGSPSQSIPSSPPSAVLRTFQSASSLALPPPESGTFARPRASSKSSTPSASDVQSVGSNAAPVQYPTVRAPSSTCSRAETSVAQQTQQSQTRPSQSMTESPDGWNAHLSTIPSEWSAERQLSVPSTLSPIDPTSVGRIRGSGTSSWDYSKPSIPVVDESQDESSDHIGYLRPVTPAPPASSRSSSFSRLGSFRSTDRPGSSASNLFRAIPSWARIYYKSGGVSLQMSALSFLEGSRPSTGVSENGQIFSPAPGEISCPRTRAQPQLQPESSATPQARPQQQQQQQQKQQQEQQQQQQLRVPDPRDPRAHWREGAEASEVEPTISSTEDPGPMSWSPHLLHDTRDRKLQRNPWKPPSLDEAAEGILSLRNAQIYLFCLGFIFPLAWILASFLPLPPNADKLNEGASTSRPDLENALQDTVSSTDYARHESAKWWRKVNRIMTPVGLAIIVVVVTLAVLGTRGVL